MIVVDSSVWVDYFNQRETEEVRLLRRLLPQGIVAVGDIILTEVLQGFRSPRSVKSADQLLSSLEVVGMLGAQRAKKSAELYRSLRRRGITIRSTPDVIIASFCLTEGLALLYADRDFDQIAEHAGLLSAAA
ncbi:MAG: PIN domain nuclease [Bacteroidota bacterium]